MKITKLNRYLFPAAALAVSALLTACSSGSSSGGEDKPTGVAASVMCEKFIKKDARVKSPGSLKFSGTSETKTKTLRATKPWKFEVRGWIDSANTYGALMRNKYSCTVSTKDNDTWTLDNLTFLTHN